MRGEGVTPVWRKAGGAAGCDAGVASRVAEGSIVRRATRGEATCEPLGGSVVVVVIAR